MIDRRRLLALLALPAGLARAEPAEVSSQPLFEARLLGLDGAPATVPRGRPLLVNFWARWCGPCKAEIPTLAALHARRGGVDVLGIALENDPAPVRDFARAYEMPYPLLLAPGAAGLDLLRALGNPNAALPFTLALDRRGTVAALRLGLLTHDAADAAAARALR